MQEIQCMVDTDRQKDGWKEGKYQQIRGQKITLAVMQLLQKKDLKEKCCFFLSMKSRVHILL